LELANRDLFVFTDKATGRPLFACKRANGLHDPLGIGGAQYFFPPPALAIAGDVEAAAAVFPLSDEDPFGPISSVLYVERVGTHADETLYATDLYAGSIPAPKAVSIKVRSNGSAAWMTCPPSTSFVSDLVSGSRARCRRTGTEIFVYEHDAAQGTSAAPILLAQGTNIDPGSLLLHGTVLSWKQAGSTVTAHLY
jgi:hypothetical protein